jgi:hypothetical protein
MVADCLFFFFNFLQKVLDVHFYSVAATFFFHERTPPEFSAKGF